MNRITGILLTLLTLLTLVSCSEIDEEGDSAGIAFDHYSQHYYTYDTIWFINQSSALFDFYWDFGNASDTAVHPVHIYSQPGTYQVTLKAYASGHLAGTDSARLEISQPTDLYIKVYLRDSITPADSCRVYVFDSFEKWQASNGYSHTGITNEKGSVLFRDLDTTVYYVTAVKTYGDQLLINHLPGYYTSPLVENQINYYQVVIR